MKSKLEMRKGVTAVAKTQSGTREDRPPAVAEPSSPPTTTYAEGEPERRRVGRPRGKKSHAGYKQFSALIPKSLYTRIKTRTFLSHEELSAYVERALVKLDAEEPMPKLNLE